MLHLSRCKLLITNNGARLENRHSCLSNFKSKTDKNVCPPSINIQKRILKTLNQHNRNFLAFLPAILWAVFIFGLSAMPSVNLPEVWFDLFSIDKLAHAFVYGVLTLLIIRGYFLNSNLTKKTKVLAVITAGIFGISMEIMQYAFFPNRYFEFLDIIANICGSIVSLFFTRYFIK
ncbi:MAG: VanZ family protein [Saprospiraceae bacterium]